MSKGILGIGPRQSAAANLKIGAQVSLGYQDTGDFGRPAEQLIQVKPDRYKKLDIERLDFDENVPVTERSNTQ